MTARTFLAWVLVLAAFAVGATPAAAQVEKAFINPAGGYTHVVTVKDRGVKTIYVSGQVGSGIDLQAHAESAFQGVADPGADFELTRIGPSRGFSQAVVERHGAVKTIWVSGQTGRGDDLTAQTSFVFERVSQRLADAGAAMADVVKINTYIVNFDPEQHMGRSVRDERRRSATTRRRARCSVSTDLSTTGSSQSLYSTTALFEYEGIAVVQP